jgi:leucyl/phenylalanyl-tRNA--protein transferase
MIPWLEHDNPFPPVATALREPNGLLAAGADLSPGRLIAAYQRGIFPWFSDGEPILWWSPDPRLVLFPEQLKISRSLAKTLRHGAYRVTLDTAFTEVISACANTPRACQPGTWIVSAMQTAYQRLHQIGIAHSVETWCDGELAGGLYGIALGRAFFGESMFSRRSNASKIALAHLCQHLQAQGFGIIDCQMETAHLQSLGARPLPRAEFLDHITRLVADATAPAPALWPADAVAHAFRRSA